MKSTKCYWLAEFIWNYQSFLREKHIRRLIVSKALITSILLTTVFNISNVSANYLSNLKQLAKEAAEHYEVDVGLIFAIIQQESGWQAKVVSHAGAIGVMQIIPSTGKSACGLTKTELFKVDKNIYCGVKYFSQQLKKFDNVELALCAYNAGPGRAKDGLARCNRISETRKYIKNIMRTWGSGTKYIEIPDNFFVDSAKNIADNRFIYGDYQKHSQWWRLVCEAVDEVYYKKHGKKEPAITELQQNLWRKILSATVDDIYADIKRLGQKNNLSKNTLRSKIKYSCPKIESQHFTNLNESAIDIADKWFEQSGSKSPNDWWRLLCKAIDKLYYRKTGTWKAITEKQKRIWHNLLNATIDEFYTNEVDQGKNSWSKRKIRSKIIDSCP